MKLAGATAAAGFLQVTRVPMPALAAPAIRSRWVFQDGLPSSGIFESPILRPESRFDAVDLSWLAAGTAVTAELRVQAISGEWSDWTILHVDQHADGERDQRRYVAPILRRGQATQVRLMVEPGSALRELVVGTLDASASPAAPSATTYDESSSLADNFIIPRAGWGADESWRYENQDVTRPVLWPPQYQDVEKIVVHHTVTATYPDDIAASIRSIYFYHAIERGWGDIGYNFLVDWKGKVYEGRYGGPRVIGGHALKYNPGSMGIALLGDFETSSPPAAMINSLVKLIKAKAGNVDVTKAADFIDLIGLANLCCHGDVMFTTCPGGAARELIPAIRGRIAGTSPIDLPPPVRREWLDLDDVQFTPLRVVEGNLLEVRVKVSNPSVTTIVSGLPEPGYVYDEDENFDSEGFPKDEGTYRFTLTIDGLGESVGPYRWGFGEPIEPGDEREVVGYVRLKTPGVYTCAVSTIKELVGYLIENDYPTMISVEPPPVAPTLPLDDPSVRFFSETGHNVPEPFTSYWEVNGGLRRFGYPLTEAFYEVSETDGRQYLTQYFERARFERHTEYAGTKDEVLLGLLGRETNALRLSEKPFRPITAFPSTPERTFFSETGHSLSGTFLRVWTERGGLPIFGFPISEEFDETSETDGIKRTVQYFERNRFELHPDYAGTDDEVMLGHLGREVLIRRGWIPGADDDTPDPDIPDPQDPDPEEPPPPVG